MRRIEQRPAGSPSMTSNSLLRSCSLKPDTVSEAIATCWNSKPHLIARMAKLTRGIEPGGHALCRTAGPRRPPRLDPATDPIEPHVQIRPAGRIWTKSMRRRFRRAGGEGQTQQPSVPRPGPRPPSSRLHRAAAQRWPEINAARLPNQIGGLAQSKRAGRWLSCSRICNPPLAPLDWRMPPATCWRRDRLT